MFSGHSHITIFGMTGSGKSVLCRNLQGYFKNVIVFDTLYEYSDNEGLVFNNFNQFADYLIMTKNELIMPKLIIRFNPDIDETSEINNYLKMIYFRGDCTIVLEEVQNYASVHKIPKYLKQISLTGRHKKVNFITTTQRIAEIHKSLLSQAHHVFCGFTDNSLDLKTLNDNGFSINLVEQINQYEFIWKNNREYYYVNNNLDILTY
jgi:hypothetical protein